MSGEMALAIGLLVGLFILFGIALLKAGVRNPRWFLVVVLVLIALYQFGSAQLQRDLEYVDLVVRGTDGCPANKLRVDISNADTRDVLRLSFNLVGYLPDYSEPVIRETVRTDRIIRPGANWSNCWAVDGLKDLPIQQQGTLRWELAVTGIDLSED
jgi:hypothetical protein